LRAVNDIASDDFHRLSFYLMYHACFGSIAQTVRFAEQLLNAADTFPGKRVAILLDVGYAKYRIGMSEEADQHLRRALDAAREKEMQSAELYALLYLAQLCWSMERIDECATWHGELAQLVSCGSLSGIKCDFCIVGARVALHNKDFAKGRDFITEARECAQADAELPRMHLLTCEIDLALAATEEKPSTAQVNELWSLHERARSLGGQDEVVITLHSALTSLGRGDEARRMITRYLRERRSDGFALRSGLAVLSGRFGSPDHALGSLL
jgi:hypothetical protein